MTVPRSGTRAAEMLCGLGSQPVDTCTAFPGLASCLQGLVEVVAGDEIDILTTLERAPGQPLVQLGPPPLREAAVRDVPNQAVPKRPAGAAGVVCLAGTDELAPDESQQRGRGVCLHELGNLLRRE